MVAKLLKLKAELKGMTIEGQRLLLLASDEAATIEVPAALLRYWYLRQLDRQVMMVQLLLLLAEVMLEELKHKPV